MPTLWRVINSDTSLITIVYFVSLHSFINYQFHGFFDIHEDSTCIGIGGQGFATAEYEHCDVDETVSPEAVVEIVFKIGLSDKFVSTILCRSAICALICLTFSDTNRSVDWISVKSKFGQLLFIHDCSAEPFPNACDLLTPKYLLHTNRKFSNLKNSVKRTLNTCI